MTTATMVHLVPLRARIHLCMFTLLLVLYQSQRVWCFAAFKSTSFSRSTAEVQEDAMERLCIAWELRESESMRISIQENTELVEAIEDCPDLSLWLQRGGRISKERLRAMITRHPLLLARALTSCNVQVCPPSSVCGNDDFDYNHLIDLLLL